MIDKQVLTMDEALAGIEDGMSVLAAGFGDAGVPNDLIDHLTAKKLKRLTLVGNGAVSEVMGHGQLIMAGSVDKFITSFPRGTGTNLFDKGTPTEHVNLEIVPQGTLAERVRAGGNGVGGFFTKTAAGTPLADGKEVREIDGELHVFEKPIKGDVALIKAWKADRWGNLVYAKSCRNFNPIMATAADLIIVQVSEIVELGELDPEHIITPGIYVDRIVIVDDPITLHGDEE